MKRPAYVAATVAAAALVVGLAACGSSGGSQAAPGPSGSGSSSGSAATGEPIKIGMLSPVNAPFFNDPDEVAAVKAAIADVNAAGGIKGRPLQLDWCNESNDANKAAACARSFVSNGDVATVSSITVTAADATTTILANAQIANINLHSLAPSEFKSMNNFPYDGGAAFGNAGVVAAAVKREGLKKVAIVRNDNPQTPPIENLVRIAAKNAGGELVKTVLLPTTAIPDYSSYAQQIISSGADLVDIPLGQAQAVGIINAVRQLGSNVKFAINAGGLSDNDFKQLGSKGEGTLVFGSTPWIHDTAEYPGVKDFITSMNAELARGDKDADIQKAKPFALKDWATVFSLAQVLNSMADANTPITAPNVLKAFSTATDLTMKNTTAHTWSPSKYQTAQPNYPTVATTEGYLMVVKNGQQVLTQKDPFDVIDYLK